MNIDHLEALARDLGGERVRKTVSKIGCTCLLAKWSHSKGRDSNPSMVLFLHGPDKGEPIYSCSACHKEGSVRDLVIFHWIKTGRNMMKWIELLDGEVTEEQFHSRKKMGDRFSGKTWASEASVHTRGRQDHPQVARKASSSTPFFDYKCLEELDKVEEIPWSEYEPYLIGVPRYAMERGLTIETCKAWDLGHDKSMRRLLFPMKDYKGRLVAVSGRSYGCAACGCKQTTKRELCSSCGSDDVDDDEYGNPFCSICGGDVVTKGRSMCAKCGKYSSPKYLHSKGFKRNLMLFGMHRKSQDWHDGRVYVCEGHLDVIRLWQAGYRPVVGLLGSAPGAAQVEMLVRDFKKIIVVPDGDSAGDSMATKLKQMIADRIKVQVRRMPAGKDPGELTTEELLEFIGEPTFCVAPNNDDC